METMKLDTVNLAHVLGAQLLEFLNTAWGSPESAACDLFGDPSFAAQAGCNLSDLQASRVLRVFIESFDHIAKVAGWTGTSLLACAIAVESWIENLGDEAEERVALLGLLSLLNATSATADGGDYRVLSLRANVEARLQKLGVVVNQ